MHLSWTTALYSKIKQVPLIWSLAITVALLIHALLFFFLGTPQWLTDMVKPAKQSATLQIRIQQTPVQTTKSSTFKPTIQKEAPDNGISDIATPVTPNEKTRAKQAPIPETEPNHQTASESEQIHKAITEKSPLLDLSKIKLSPDKVPEEANKIFSKELIQKIEASKLAQQEYLKGVKKQTHYPITVDADGTRYVNIKGVCWKMPKEGGKDAWAIVFDGCGIKEKAFHFELNISPSLISNELLGPDSPFTMGK